MAGLMATARARRVGSSVPTQNSPMVFGSPAPLFAPEVKVLGVEAFEQPFRLRMPFRFGVITLTEGRQAYVRVHLRLDDGREGFGYAAEMLAAKWFDKNPALSDADNYDQLRKAI